MDPAWIVLAILVASLVAFATDAARYETVAIAAVVALIVTGCLEYREAFAAFAAPAPVMVASMYVFSRSVSRSGLADDIGRRFLGSAKSEAALAFRVTLVAGLLSSVLSDTAVTASLLPIVHAAGRRAHIPASKLLIPLSFGSLLGGMVTVVGTSSNIALNDVLAQLGEPTVGVFDFAHLGIFMVGLGALYFLGPGRRLLPSRRVDESLAEHYAVPRFLTEVLVEPTSTLIGRSSSELSALAERDVRLIGILREGGTSEILVPGPYDRIRSGDTLILQGEPDSILDVFTELGLRETADPTRGPTRLATSDVQLVEAVVPAGSDLVGRSLVTADFRATTGLSALAISKHGHVRPMRVARARLAVGDTLLLQGHRRDVERARAERQVLILGEHTLPRTENGSRLTTLVLLALVVAIPALGILPLPAAALAGALALVLTRCVRSREAIDAIDWSVIVLIGGLLAVGQAFDQHGLAERGAQAILRLAEGGLAPFAALVIVLIGTVLLTQLTTNISAVVVMAPVALSLARELAVDARPFVMTVLLGASCAFLSPVSHAANTMVAGPGDYRFRDFTRAGLPLTLIVGFCIATLVPLLWPF